MKMSKERFIKFYNVFMEKGNYKLSPIEWYFYSLLAARWSPFLDCTETTVSIIADVQKKYNDCGRPTRNKENTLKQLLALKSKGVIDFDSDSLNINGKMNFDKAIKVTFTDFKKSESITMSVYERTDEPEENYFMCILQRFREKGFSHSMENLADLLECNVKTANKIIERMKEKRLIKYTQGEKKQLSNGAWSSTPNVYFICDVNEQKTVVEDDIITNVPSGSSVVEYGNWKGSGNLTDSDYILYAENKDNAEFIKVAENKINRITKNKTNEKSLYMIDKAIKNAEKFVDRKRKEQMELKKEQNDERFINENNDKSIIRDNEGNLSILDDSTFKGMELETVSKVYGSGFIITDGREIPFGEPFKRCSRETKEIIYKEMNKLLEKNKKLTFTDIDSLIEMRKHIVDENNKGKKPEDEWEGDFIDIDCNYSRQERLYKVKRERDKKKYEDERNFIESLFN